MTFAPPSRRSHWKCDGHPVHTRRQTVGAGAPASAERGRSLKTNRLTCLVPAALCCAVVLAARVAVGAEAKADDAQAPIEPIRLGGISGLTPDDQATLLRTAEFARGLTYTSPPPFQIISASEAMFYATNGVPEEELREQDEMLNKSAELGVWMGLLSKDVDLKKITRTLVESEVAGFYSTHTKRIFVNRDAITNEDGVSDAGIVLVHELAHALDDQRGFMDTNDYADTDAQLAQECMTEGSAMLAMVDALPALLVRQMDPELQKGADNRLFLFLTSMLSAFRPALVREMAHFAKESVSTTNGIPEVVMREVEEPYLSGLVFCDRICARWGLDGLDYVLRKPPETTHQVLNPDAYWGWRDWPEHIEVSTNGIPGVPGWSCILADAVGEADMAIWLDCLLGDGHGRSAVRGWQGDRLVFYGNDTGHRLLVWASAWGSGRAARRFERTYRDTLTARFGAQFSASPDGFAWNGSSNRVGRILRSGRHVILIETDDPAALQSAEQIAAHVRYAPSPEEEARRAQNPALLRYNPVLSRSRDDDWATWQALLGVYRLDRCAIGSHQALLGGWLAETRHSRTSRADSLLAGWVYRRVAEQRRGAVRLRVLPLGVAVNYSRSDCPTAEGQRFSRGSLCCGLLGSWECARTGRVAVRVLPFGWLLAADEYRKDGTPIRHDRNLLPWGLLWHDSRGLRGAESRHGRALAGLLWSRRNDERGAHTTVLPFGLLFRMDRSKAVQSARVLGLPVYRRIDSTPHTTGSSAPAADPGR